MRRVVCLWQADSTSVVLVLWVFVIMALPKQVSSTPSHFAPQPLLSVRIHAIRVADNDGRRAVSVTSQDVAQTLDRVNRIYAPAGIQFLFDTYRDWSTLDDTTINNLSSFVSPAWDRANAIAAQHPGKLVVVFRHGEGAIPTGNGFSFPAQSGFITNFVAMPGIPQTNGNLFAHVVGSYLGLYHTFPGWEDSATDTPEKAADFIASPTNCSLFPWICSASGTPNALDGDNLSDTPPEAGTAFYINQGFDLCVGHNRYTITGTNIVFRGSPTNPIMEEVPFRFTFAPDRHNVLSFFPCEPRTFTRMQIEVMRRTLIEGRAPVDLTGTWTADDGGVYYVRQLGNTVWWVGLSTESPEGSNDFHKGLHFTNVFRGTRVGDVISGEWADVPKGEILQSGPLTFDVFPIRGPGGIELRRRSEFGLFGGSVWTRAGATASVCDVPCGFQFVRRNDGNTMRDHLDPVYDYNYVAFGFVQSPVLAVNFPPGVARTYTNFMCPKPEEHQQPWYRGFGDPPDGDIHFDIGVESERDNYTVELIMFGRSTGDRFCGDPIRFNIAPLLPGWAESGANSVLLNGRPINSQVTIAVPSGPNDPCNRMLDDTNAGSCKVLSILNRTIQTQTRLRITGAKVRDDHDKLEIHPVYSVDILQNFHIPRPNANLTGVWDATDNGTYYVRQIGNVVWWLGLSRDRGLSFTNVFRGTLDGNTISGEWADLPLGNIRSSGSLKLTASIGSASTVLEKGEFSGGFGAQRWGKLFDVP